MTSRNIYPDTTSRTVAGVTVLNRAERYEGATTGEGFLGRLTVVDGCLAFHDSVLLLPNGTRVGTDAGHLIVGLQSERGSYLTFRIGDQIDFGGATLSPVYIKDSGRHLAAVIPPRCRDHPMIVMYDGIRRGR